MIDLCKHCCNLTDDRCQFVTLSIYLCVQHIWHETVHVVGLSVAFETPLIIKFMCDSYYVYYYGLKLSKDNVGSVRVLT